MDELVKMYFDWISDYDPYLSPQEIIESDLPDMLYNLEHIRELNDLEDEDLESIDKVIAAFKAAGIESF